MPNTSVRAAAEGLPNITRRTALAVTGSGLIAALAGVAASAAQPAPDAELIVIGRELDAALAEWRIIDAEANRLLATSGTSWPMPRGFPPTSAANTVCLSARPSMTAILKSAVRLAPKQL